MPLAEHLRAKCEALIDGLVATRGMAREVAIVALTLKDQKRVQAGLGPQVEGAHFEMAYPGEVLVHEDDVAKIVSFLEGVPMERAKELTKERIESGVFKAETQH